MDINIAVLTSVALFMDKMSDEEVAAISNAIAFDFDPKPVMGYEKCKSLFTEYNGTRMHADTKAVFLELVQKRLFN
jgi:hypothetical protein